MRIAMVCPYSFSEPGGVQQHVAGLGGWLTSRGHQVSLLAPGSPAAGWLSSHGLPERSHTSLGRAVAVPYNGSVARVTFGPTTSTRVRRWLEQVGADVIHVHEPITPSASVHAVWARNAPVLATFHTATPGSTTMKLAGQLMGSTVGAISAGIAVSNAARDVVRRHIGLEPVVIGNGITVPKLPQPAAPHRHLGPWRAGSRPRITFLGRYDEPRKGFGVFLAAIDQLRVTHPDLDVVVVGGGRDRHVPGVRFLGRVDDATRDELLGSTDIYVAPHLGRESFGVVLLEALAAGARVVASDLPAFREVLTDQAGVHGELVPPADPVALAEGIRRSLTAPHDEVGGRARAAQFSWDVVGPQILDEYRALARPVPGRIGHIA